MNTFGDILIIILKVPALDLPNSVKTPHLGSKKRYLSISVNIVKILNSHIQISSLLKLFFTEKVLPNLIKNAEELRAKVKTRGIKLLIYNASSHTAKLTKNFLESEGLDLLPHPPYFTRPSSLLFLAIPQAQNLPSGRELEPKQTLGSALYHCFKSIPEEEYRNAFIK